MSNRFRNGLSVFMLVVLATRAFGAGFLTRELVNGRGNSPLVHANEDMELFNEAWGLIQDNFLGSMPDSRTVTYGAIRGSLATLNDPYTVFIEPAAREVERERLQGTIGGIGANISRSEETGEVLLETIPGNPADAAGKAPSSATAASATRGPASCGRNRPSRWISCRTPGWPPRPCRGPR